MKEAATRIQSLGDDISVIDLMEGGVEGRTGCYVIRGEKIALVETGTSLSVPYLLGGLKALQIDPGEVDYVIVTHIHLDHSGGAGKLLPYLPHATVVVHERGARHLIDPSRLLKGARAVYGDVLERMFGEVLPVPEDRVWIRREKETVDLGGGRVLTFYDTPGHARHHFSIYDSGSGGVFSGDTLGVRYVKELTGADCELIFPVTSPPEFDLAATLDSIDKLAQLQPSKIFHSHYGVTEPASIAFDRIRETAEVFVQLARACHPLENNQEVLKEKLRDYVIEEHRKRGVETRQLNWPELDLELSAMGLIIRLEAEEKTSNQS